MTKLLVFDKVNLQTALLARQILDMNSGIWIFMGGDIPKHTQPVMFLDDDNMSWLLNFCNLNVVALHQDNDIINVCVPDVTQETLIDRLLNKPNISLTTDTPCTIDYDNRRVRLDDTVGFSYVPFGDVTSIFVTQPIDNFYGFKFGHVLYRNMPPLNIKPTQCFNAVDIFYEPGLNGGLFNRRLSFHYDTSEPIRSDVKFDLVLAKPSIDEVFAVDCVETGNIDLYHRYIAHNKPNKQIKYIGPRTVAWPINPFLIDMTSLFDIIGKI